MADETDKLVTVAVFESYIKAEMARQLLEDFGIKSVVTGQNAANVYSLPGIAKVTLQTFESRAKEAKDILEPKENKDITVD